MLTLYKMVVRDKNGKVVQIHEREFGTDKALFGVMIAEECEKGYSVTTTIVPN